jgi:hypothetical protein
VCTSCICAVCAVCCCFQLHVVRSALYGVRCALYILLYVAAHIVRFRPNATTALSTNTHHAIVISPLTNDRRIRLRCAQPIQPCAVVCRIAHLMVYSCRSRRAEPTQRRSTRSDTRRASAESTASACSAADAQAAPVCKCANTKGPTVRRQREWRMSERTQTRQRRTGRSGSRTRSARRNTASGSDSS